MFRRHLWRVALAVSVLPTLASAQGLRVVRPVPGLVCMSLDDQTLAANRQSAAPPVLAEPNPAARRIGYPTRIVFVR